MTPEPPAILVADDHDLVRIGLCQLLRQWRQDVELTEAADGLQLWARLQERDRWSLVLIDLAMPHFNGEGDIRRLLARQAGIPVLVVSGNSDAGAMTRLLDAGVSGFLPKALDGRLMVKAIELVLAGGRYVPPEALAPLSANVSRVGPDDAEITPRQREILALLLQGLPNKVIATRLAIAEATVKMHVTALLKAHGAQSRAELVARVYGGRVPP